ncbi:carbamoyltransferase HypF [Uliginosibacterium sp. 31-12]|uniref:carbamoyltransferase HypF n=1 Tax=Uliginosibacterium sp. 31-12 TaxID=3062781 RepID=UPI0026E11433|nr:carbamoyltransferase HypF [Uliginosibacterium sp. 31-12]MDO6385658.1 carbamoyltransferase HypF [Uliginosibacterium sp. 31-12]
MSLQRRHLTLSGIVQGVGFRPFVHRLAHELSLGGWVQNRSGQVQIEIEGLADTLDSFSLRLIKEAPPLAKPQILENTRQAIAQSRRDFVILASHTEDAPDIHLPADTHLCADCRRELFDPANRRFRYPFINCTQCGPRYTLIAELPYDRERTSMASFPLCPACRAEYENPAERRFHAEPLACPVCGPQLRWHDETGEAALQAALSALREGQIIAVRGVGGYHLMCDARNATTVTRLRARKQRPARPFALLFDECGEDGNAMLNEYLAPNPGELALLHSPQRPIVLIEACAHHALAAGIAPGMRRIGAMLPHSPLQALLAADFGAPLVATSGNLSGEPICLDPADAEARLGRIADGFLHHDRPILRPAEDSVWQCAATPMPIRLGRGEAPQEWQLPGRLAQPTLALGGEQKVCIALGWEDRAVISPHIGDLDHPESMAWLARVVADFSRLYRVTPERIALDAHPHYRSHQHAVTSALPLHEIWHHHAHASALAAEHPQIKNWLTFTWDGVGLGPDGQLWGGEVLLGVPGHWQRVASLRPFRLPGGEAASRECWRSAAGLFWEAGLSCPPWHPQLELLRQAWQGGLNSPSTSAIGRVFDAAAAILGVCTQASFEGEAPMRLQALAESVSEGPLWPIHWQTEAGLWLLDWQAWLAGLRDLQIPVAARAWALHDALARAAAELIFLLALPGETAIGGCGGVFQNRLLTERLQDHLGARPLLLPQRQPPNDAGLALGQLMEILAKDCA